MACISVFMPGLSLFQEMACISVFMPSLSLFQEMACISVFMPSLSLFQEMACISVFMQGNSNQRQYPQHYMESAVSTYLNTCKYVSAGCEASEGVGWWGCLGNM